MDTNSLKGRIAEALVEGVFRRAGYQVALVGRESRVQHLMKIGPAEFLPDFLVWKQVPGPDPAGGLHRLVAIEVKYRGDVQKSLQRETSRFLRGVRQWHDLYFIFVTDHPEPGRSCFQAVDLRQCAPGAPWVAMDLHEASDLDIYWKTVEEYESLVKLIFPILSAPPRAEAAARKPEVKLAGRMASLRGGR
jgi:hypothetical protein